MIRFILATLLLAVPAAAQPPLRTGLEESLAGAWFAGACARPEAVLFVTARTAARVPAEGAPAEATSRLFRFTALREVAGWTLGTGIGADSPRLLLKPDFDALVTVEPDAKTRDDRLPGDAPQTRWARCPSPPLPVLALHAEGVALLAALEHVEAACAGGLNDACLAAVVAAGDVSGDRALSVAELARLMRGASWILAVSEAMNTERLASFVGIGALTGLFARAVVDSYDYDGDNKLSAAELGQDRAAFGAARGTAAGAPLRADLLIPGLDSLRGLLGSLGLGM